MKNSNYVNPHARERYTNLPAYRKSIRVETQSFYGEGYTSISRNIDDLKPQRTANSSSKTKLTILVKSPRNTLNIRNSPRVKDVGRLWRPGGVKGVSIGDSIRFLLANDRVEAYSNIIDLIVQSYPIGADHWVKLKFNGDNEVLSVHLYDPSQEYLPLMQTSWKDDTLTFRLKVTEEGKQASGVVHERAVEQMHRDVERAPRVDHDVTPVDRDRSTNRERTA